MNRLHAAVAAVLVALVGLSIAVGKGVFGPSEGPGITTPGASAKASSSDASCDATGQSPGPAMAAMDQAAQAKKYLFALFWKEEDQPTIAMRRVFAETMQRLADRAQSVVVRITDPAERDIVEKYDLDRAPLPLVLAIAPNGAIMGGFPTQFEESDLLAAFGTPASEQCMKALQDTKLVFVCVQNKRTKSNEAAMRGVRDFAADARFSHATEIVTIDPSDAAEASYLADLKIDPKEREAVTAFLSPPGSVIAEFRGATNKDDLVTSLLRASTSCGPGGCGPNGCGPKP